MKFGALYTHFPPNIFHFVALWFGHSWSLTLNQTPPTLLTFSLMQTLMKPWKQRQKLPHMILWLWRCSACVSLGRARTAAPGRAEAGGGVRRKIKRWWSCSIANPVVHFHAGCEHRAHHCGLQCRCKQEETEQSWRCKWFRSTTEQPRDIFMNKWLILFICYTHLPLNISPPWLAAGGGWGGAEWMNCARYWSKSSRSAGSGLPRWHTNTPTHGASSRVIFTHDPVMVMMKMMVVMMMRSCVAVPWRWCGWSASRPRCGRGPRCSPCDPGTSCCASGGSGRWWRRGWSRPHRSWWRARAAWPRCPERWWWSGGGSWIRLSLGSRSPRSERRGCWERSPYLSGAPPEPDRG